MLAMAEPHLLGHVAIAGIDHLAPLHVVVPAPYRVRPEWASLQCVKVHHPTTTEVSRGRCGAYVAFAAPRRALVDSLSLQHLGPNVAILLVEVPGADGAKGGGSCAEKCPVARWSRAALMRPVACSQAAGRIGGAFRGLCCVLCTARPRPVSVGEACIPSIQLVTLPAYLALMCTGRPAHCVTDDEACRCQWL